jgi:hypothetical protein
MEVFDETNGIVAHWNAGHLGRTSDPCLGTGVCSDKGKGKFDLSEGYIATKARRKRR